MTPITLKALEESIEHWRQNLAAESPFDANTDGGCCALCIEFNSHMATGRKGCSGCPVAECTGIAECNLTPYYTARSALDRWKAYPKDDRYRDDWRTSAQAELDFLISLRPKGA